MDLIEKDILLHSVLLRLSKDEFFINNFVFKGGTCLIKCYLNYFRFSEDVDFTWKNQGTFSGKSGKQIREEISLSLKRVMPALLTISEELGLDFKAEKSNKTYCEIGGSNKLSTFKLWYRSAVTQGKSFIKIQLNFVEHICYNFIRHRLTTLHNAHSDKLSLLFEEYAEYSEEIYFDVYDPREILCEKVRATLTRKEVKNRDMIDIYLIHKELRIEAEDLENCIRKKLDMALSLYYKYRKNYEFKLELLKDRTLFTSSLEENILLIRIDENDYYSYVRQFEIFLKNIVKV